MAAAPTTAERRNSYPAPLPCGCPVECDCPPYAKAAAGFFAVTAMVLMSPVFLYDVSPFAGFDLHRIVQIGTGAFLVLAAFQIAIIAFVVLIAVCAGREHAAVRIWTAARTLVGMLLGAAGGVGCIVLLWGMVNLGWLY